MLLSFVFFFFFKGSYSGVSVKNSSGIFAANQMTDHHYLHYQVTAEKEYQEPRDFSLGEKDDALICYQSIPC